ncbi:hypothetical protein BD414DRAFT_474876 [Trametes punicea]|nr:hypothetical protein BD414DRAFT_474876 [Trametes punicea]
MQSDVRLVLLSSVLFVAGPLGMNKIDCERRNLSVMDTITDTQRILTASDAGRRARSLGCLVSNSSLIFVVSNLTLRRAHAEVALSSEYMGTISSVSRMRTRCWKRVGNPASVILPATQGRMSSAHAHDP